MKGFACVLLCFFFFACPISVYAVDSDVDGVYEELRTELFDESKLELDKESQKKMEDYSVADYSEQLKNLSVDNIFNEVLLLFKSGFKRPFLAAVSLIAVLIVTSVLMQLNPKSESLGFLCQMCVIVFLVLPVSSVVAAFSDALKSAGTFFSSFIPIFTGLVVAKGKAVTASVTSATLLIVCQFLQQAASFLVVPLCGMQLSLQIGSSFLNEMNFTSLARTITKFSMWVLTAVSTVFLGVLGLQTLISAPADSLSLKTLRFVVGSAVPVVGNIVAESIGAVSGSLKLLSSSAAIYTIVAVALLLLPVIADIVLWKVAIFVSKVVAEFLGLSKASQLIASADSCFSLCLGVTVLSLLLFTISVTVISLV